MRKTIDVTQAPTPEQIAMLTEAAKLPIPDDDEYPEFTEDLQPPEIFRSPGVPLT